MGTLRIGMRGVSSITLYSRKTLNPLKNVHRPPKKPTVRPRVGSEDMGNYPRNATGGLQRGQDRRDLSVVRRGLGQSAATVSLSPEIARDIRIRDYLVSTLRLIFTLGRLSN